MNSNKKQTTDLKTALITGSARRIGKAIAEDLHARGFRVAIHCNQSLEEAGLLVRAFNEKRAASAELFVYDLSKKDATKSLVAAVNDWASQLDVLVNNASLFIKTNLESFDEKDLQDWQDLWMLNVQVPFELSNYARPMLAARHGSIINITDIHAETPLKDYAVYCQTKAALTMQTKALAKAFAPDIRVNAVAPGAIIWPENDSAITKDIKAKIIQQTPLGCSGQPEYIAKAISALIDNPFITGQILAVDGGRSIG